MSLRHKGLDDPDSVLGAYHAHRFERTGRFWSKKYMGTASFQDHLCMRDLLLARVRGNASAFRLAAAGSIAPIYRNKCPACQELVKDSLDHIVVRCPAYAVHRTALNPVLDAKFAYTKSAAKARRTAGAASAPSVVRSLPDADIVTVVLGGATESGAHLPDWLRVPARSETKLGGRDDADSDTTDDADAAEEEIEVDTDFEGTHPWDDADSEGGDLAAEDEHPLFPPHPSPHATRGRVGRAARDSPPPQFVLVARYLHTVFQLHQTVIRGLKA